MTPHSRRGFMLGMIYAFFAGLPLHIDAPAYYYTFAIPLLVVSCVSMAIALVKDEFMT